MATTCDLGSVAHARGISPMIANLTAVFAAPRSARIVLGTLSARRIKETFAQIRAELSARTIHVDVRKREHNSGVTWSIWIGRFEKSVSWLKSDRFVELRYAFLLLMERKGFLAVLGSNVGDAAELVAEAKISYQKLLALHSGSTTEIDSLSTQSLRAAGVGVARSTQSGRHLERVLSRVGANQQAPSHLSLRQYDRTWRVSPGSGRISLSGGRVTVEDICGWFTSTCEEIERDNEPSDFMRAFAHPVAIAHLPSDVRPVALQFDATALDDLIEFDATLYRNDQPLTDHEIEDVRALVSELWMVDEERTAEDEQAKAWRLRARNRQAGQLTFHSTKISLKSSELAAINVESEDGTKENLNQVFNKGSQLFRLSFSDPTFGYAAGQLFRDHRLLGSRQALVDMLSPRLNASANTEKAALGGRFTTDSLFGFVAQEAGVDDDYLVCDDVGTEWADFIGVSTTKHRITFYHCKGGVAQVGASKLHEVVSQANKNLGYLTATRQELENRMEKWEGSWNQMDVPRLQRGSSVNDFVDAFTKSVVAPQATRCVTLVTSALSKGAVATAFAAMENGVHQAEPFHVLWLLLAFVDQCRLIGALPQIICRP